MKDVNYGKENEMKVLVACEESQAVTIAFREKGHESFPCNNRFTVL